jgi:hypothetical protein
LAAHGWYSGKSCDWIPRRNPRYPQISLGKNKAVRGGPTYPGVILRRDWQTIKFYNATVDREKDNFVEFKGDECRLRLNSNTKTNPDGSQPRKEFSITGTRLAQTLTTALYRLLDHHLFDPNRRNLNPMVPAATTMTVDNTFDFKAYDY